LDQNVVHFRRLLQTPAARSAASQQDQQKGQQLAISYKEREQASGRAGEENTQREQEFGLG